MESGISDPRAAEPVYIDWLSIHIGVLETLENFDVVTSSYSFWGQLVVSVLSNSRTAYGEWEWDFSVEIPFIQWTPSATSTAVCVASIVYHNVHKALDVNWNQLYCEYLLLIRIGYLILEFSSIKINTTKNNKVGPTASIWWRCILSLSISFGIFPTFHCTSIECWMISIGGSFPPIRWWNGRTLFLRSWHGMTSFLLAILLLLLYLLQWSLCSFQLTSPRSLVSLSLCGYESVGETLMCLVRVIRATQPFFLSHHRLKLHVASHSFARLSFSFLDQGKII